MIDYSEVIEQFKKLEMPLSVLFAAAALGMTMDSSKQRNAGNLEMMLSAFGCAIALNKITNLALEAEKEE